MLFLSFVYRTHWLGIVLFFYSTLLLCQPSISKTFLFGKSEFIAHCESLQLLKTLLSRLSSSVSFQLYSYAMRSTEDIISGKYLQTKCCQSRRWLRISSRFFQLKIKFEYLAKNLEIHLCLTVSNFQICNGSKNADEEFFKCNCAEILLSSGVFLKLIRPVTLEKLEYERWNNEQFCFFGFFVPSWIKYEDFFRFFFDK